MSNSKTKKMNPAVKAQWVAALRSGEYAQVTGGLRTKGEDGFCCLGVLCDLHSKEVGGEWNEDGDGEAYMGAYGTPPTAVVDWAGLNGYNPSLTVEGKTSFVAIHNDAGRTFAEIADAIEAQL